MEIHRESCCYSNGEKRCKCVLVLEKFFRKGFNASTGMCANNYLLLFYIFSPGFVEGQKSTNYRLHLQIANSLSCRNQERGKKVEMWYCF